MAFEKVRNPISVPEDVTDTVESVVVESKTEAIKSNRSKFIKAFYVVAILWFFVVVFALGGIWAPAAYGLATNFTATAWLLGVPTAFASLLLLFCAEEFMDVQ